MLVFCNTPDRSRGPALQGTNVVVSRKCPNLMPGETCPCEALTTDPAVLETLKKEQRRGMSCPSHADDKMATLAGFSSGSPGVPVGTDARNEARRWWAVQSLRQRQRIPLQLTAAALDYRLDPPECAAREGETRRLHPVAQDGEVVIVPETTRKHVGPSLKSLHAAGSNRFEKLQLMPQVLRLLAAFVQVLVTRFPSHHTVAVASGTIHALDTSPQDRPSATGRPTVRAVAYTSYRLPDRGHHVFITKLTAAKLPAIGRQAPAHDAEGPPLRPRSPPREAIERVDENLGVANFAERPRGIPQRVVLPPVLAVGKRRTRQS
jgi:hypothetical protein